MKILIFNQYFWPESFRINEVAHSLKILGHDVEVMTGKPNYPEGEFYTGYSAWGVQKELWKDITIWRLPMLARGKKSGIKLALNYCSYIFSGLIFAPWVLRKKKYDLIFVYGVSPIFQVLPASFLGWLKAIPVVLWVQDLWPQSAEATGYVKSPALLKLLEYFVRFSYSHTDLLLVQSKAFIDPVSKLALNKPVSYYPNSVEKEFYSPKQVELPIIEHLETGFTVLFAGNVGTAQSMETIVDAAEKLQVFTEIKVLIMGSGSMSDWVAQQVVERSLNNIYQLGRFPVETMPGLMRKASVLLVSLTNQPIFELTVPNKIQAYLAVGKPIIASLNGEGARLVKESGSGLAVEAEDANGLAEAILKLYQMQESERRQMGLNGRAYFKKHFDEEMLSTDLIKHFQTIIIRRGVI